MPEKTPGLTTARSSMVSARLSGGRPDLPAETPLRLLRSQRSAHPDGTVDDDVSGDLAFWQEPDVNTASSGGCCSQCWRAQMQIFVHQENIVQYRKLIAIAKGDPNRDEARYQILL